MQYWDYNEKKLHGTYEFPFEFYHIDESHPRYVMNYHWHAEYEMIRILYGTLEITLDEKSFPAHAGDTIFIHSGILHAGLPHNCVYECLVFDLNIFLKHNPSCRPYIQSITDRSAMVYHYFAAKKYPQVREVIGNAFDALYHKLPGYELTMFGELYHFFGIVFSQHLYLSDVPQKNRDYKRIMQLKQVLEYMDMHYASHITLEQLAQSVSMSPKYFCRFFYEMTHRTPIDYLNYQRIEHACNDLITAGHSVTEAAYACGFNDLSYFIKMFKRYKGTTPKKYMSGR